MNTKWPITAYITVGTILAGAISTGAVLQYRVTAAEQKMNDFKEEYSKSCQLIIAKLENNSYNINELKTNMELLRQELKFLRQEIERK